MTEQVPQQASATLTVYKLDANGREVWHYPAAVLQRSDTSIQLEAYFNREDVDLGYVTFYQGDRFVEYFFSDRWYNIFAVYDADGQLFRGWYCNICRPAEIGETMVRCEDLALDVWVTPACDATVMDEDEFAALEMPIEDRKAAIHALEQLVRIAERGALPY